MTIERVLQREVDSAEIGESVANAAQRMGARQVGSLLVVDAQGLLAGIVTDRDLTLRVLGQGLDPDQTSVGDVMTPNPQTVMPDTSIEQALHLMRSKAVRRLPVVDSKSGLLGIVTLDDLLAGIIAEFGDLARLLEKSGPRSLAAP